MLTKFHKILIGALVVQVLLAVLLLARSKPTGAAKEQPVVAGFDAAKVTRVQIFADNADKAAIDLAKRGAAWALASHFDQPVEATKVTDALAPIAKLSAATPVATQAARHIQLQVADKTFARKVILSQDGGKDLVLFVGQGAGARRTAVRLGGDDRVWGVTGVSSSTFGDTPSQWIDSTYFKATAADIAKLTIQREGKTVELERVPAPAPAGSAAGSGSAAAPAETWQVKIDGAPVVLAKGETLDTAAIDARLADLSTIDMRQPGDPKRDASKPTATITIQRKATGTAAAPAPDVLEVIADGDKDYWVHVKGQPRAALVDMPRLRSVVTTDRDSLVKKPEPPAPPGGPGSAAMPPDFGMPPPGLAPPPP